MNWEKIIEAAIAGVLFTSLMIVITVVVMVITILTLTTSAWAFYGAWVATSAIFGRYWYKKMADD